MTERQIIVVSKVAPRLRELSSEAARAFLREYRFYENRLGVNEMKMAMKRRIEPSNLDTLMDLTYPLSGNSKVRELPPEGPQCGKVRIEAQSPIVSTSLTETLDEDNNEEEDEEEEEETVAEGAYVQRT